MVRKAKSSRGRFRDFVIGTRFRDLATSTRFRDYVQKLVLDDPYLLHTAGKVHRDGGELQGLGVKGEVLVTEVLGLVVQVSQDQSEVLVAGYVVAGTLGIRLDI